MKKNILLLIASLFVLGMAQAQNLAEGTYRGRTVQNRDRVELFVKDYPGREGSFLAILIKDKGTGFAYLVDKFSEGKYGMTPLTSMSNAVIGMEDTNPSLTLSIVAEKNKEFIKITNNNSSNQVGFQSEMKIRFKDKARRSKLVPTSSGTFKLGRNKNGATLTAQNLAHEASLIMGTGEYTLREVRPSLHLPLLSSLANTGTEVATESDTMAFFIEGSCLFGRGDYMVLMKSGTGQLTYLKKR